MHCPSNSFNKFNAQAIQWQCWHVACWLGCMLQTVQRQIPRGLLELVERNSWVLPPNVHVTLIHPSFLSKQAPNTNIKSVSMAPSTLFLGAFSTLRL